jgi:ketosteroid isomerase-like protein
MPTALSRRKLFKAGSGALAGAALLSAAGARAGDADLSEPEKVVVAWMKLWADRKDWPPFADMLAEDFAFSSAAGDDHLSKAAFKTTCWEPNINLTKSMVPELMMSKGDEVFVKYLGRTVSGKTFRNVELHKVRDGKIVSIECFFGEKAAFPAAVESQKS